MKLVILILSTRSSTYNGFKEAIRKTWMKDSLDSNIPCYFYEGGWEKNEVVGDTIRLKSDDSLFETYQKFIDCLFFMDEVSIKYEVVFRTNLSSYIDIPVFLKFIESNTLSVRSYEGFRGETHLLRERIYVNKIFMRLSRFAKYGERISFISGSGMFLGADATKALQFYSGYKNKINIIDDVKIGWILNEMFSSSIQVDRLDIFSSGSHRLGRREYHQKVEDGLFHYKFKNKDRRFDLDNLKKIHNIAYRQSLCINSMGETV